MTLHDDAQEASLTWRVTPDMLCILDRAGCFVAVNPAWQRTLGWRREDMVGITYHGFLHPDDVERSLAAFEVVKSGRPVLRFENRYRTTSGDHRWLSWVAVPEGDRFYCTARDTTDDKARIDTIERQRAEADLRDLFLAVLGHDLRNPLAAVDAGLRLLDRKADDATLAEIMRHMRGSVGRMSEMIDNLMDLARVRLGDGLSLEQTVSDDLERDLDQVVEELRLANPDAVIRARLDISGPVRCDVPRLSQLLSNLVANAVMHGRSADPVDVEAVGRDGRLRIAVVNQGDPIPEAIRETLFQPFFRGNAQGRQEGLGLGLYIAAEIAKAHGGTLDVSSDAGETRFALDIPG